MNGQSMAPLAGAFLLLMACATERAVEADATDPQTGPTSEDAGTAAAPAIGLPVEASRTRVRDLNALPAGTAIFR